MTSPLINQAVKLATEAERQTNVTMRDSLAAEALICWGLSRLGQR
jgi:hypothetical protein